ncbi:hypothetical protein GUJ93_ZPchr0005g16096 [Zizania palustris]|uniref:Malectin-like domain-containing protein n=1 Tax=Zizania palustris TaxID=103762 RepID=A0A8J5SMD9_ZIZPA|nr:hypothetical protein GUJ93_ZPchr0005g16096 [Zizania palustris]
MCTASRCAPKKATQPKSAPESASPCCRRWRLELDCGPNRTPDTLPPPATTPAAETLTHPADRVHLLLLDHAHLPRRPSAGQPARTARKHSDSPPFPPEIHREGKQHAAEMPALLLRLLLSLILVAAAPLAAARSRQFRGYSYLLDCGATASIIDRRGLVWLPDGRYVSAGVSGKLSEQGLLDPTLATLRVFPRRPAAKFCYELPVDRNRRYLLRPTFFYGVYSPDSPPPVFDMIVDGTFWTAVNTTDDSLAGSASYYEGVFGASGRNMSFCLGVNPDYTDSGPFINALQVIQLHDSVYNATNFTSSAMGLIARTKFGSAGDAEKYPDDIFDRHWQPFLDNKHAVSSLTRLILTPVSGLPPLINAGEVFGLFPRGGYTIPRDARALESIKRSLQNIPDDWNGDPCMPHGYAWAGVTCDDSSIANVISLNFSSMGLSGYISSDIANMTSLTDISLANNNLFGPIPNLSKLRSLQRLHLQDNKLNGTVPQTLGTITTLHELFLQNNELVGPVPLNLLYKQGLTYKFLPGNHFFPRPPG